MNPVLTQGGSWVRATHVEWLSEYPAYTRPYHLEMPLLTESVASVMDYPLRDDLAFCIPISFPEQHEDAVINFEGYCKAALYLARQMAHHWDIREQGVPVFIGVSENGIDTFCQYAEHCEFPEQRLIVLPSYQDTRKGWHIKFDLLGSSQLEDFKRRVHFDASAWLRPHAEMRKTCQELLAVWKSQPFLIRDDTVLWARIDKRWQQINTWLKPDFFERLANLLGSTPEDEEAYWGRSGVEYIHGLIFGFSQSQWNAAVPLINQLRQIVPQDEVILSIVAREHGWKDMQGVCDAAKVFFSDIKPRRHVSRKGDSTGMIEEWRTYHGYDPGDGGIGDYHD